MKYARISNGIAVDVRTESPEGFYTPNIVAEFVEVPDIVEHGWLLVDDQWEAPAVVDPAPEPVPEPPKIMVSPVEFLLLFTGPERVAIKAARASDPLIDDFMDIIEDPRLTEVKLWIQSTQGGVGYLAAVGLIEADRVSEILTGEFK